MLSGGGARLAGLVDYLAAKTGLPVDVMDPASRMDISGLPVEQQALFEGGRSAEMSVALGLGMLAADQSLFRLEVVPDEVLVKRKFWRGTVWGIAAAAVFAGVLGIDYLAASRYRRRAAERHLRLLETLKGSDHAEVAEIRGTLGLGPGEKVEGFEKIEATYKQERKTNELLGRRATLLVGPGQRNVPVLGFLRLLRSATPAGIVVTRFTAGQPDADSNLSAKQVEVVVKVLVNPSVVAEGDEYKALENYRSRLQTESAKLAFKIEKPKLTTGEKVGGSREFTLTARIFTLGIEDEEAEADPEVRSPVGVPLRLEPYRAPEPEPEPGPEPGPVIVPRALPSKLKPIPPAESKTKPEEPEEPEDEKNDNANNF